MDEQCQHFIPNEQERILHILENFESLFYGTLGTWKNPPVNLDLKDDAVLILAYLLSLLLQR